MDGGGSIQPMAQPITAEYLDHDERNDAPVPVAFLGLDTIAVRDGSQPDPDRPTFAIHTLGCKLNSADAQAISFALQEHGFAEVTFDTPADVYIVNTCTVTHVADRKNRQYLRRARQRGGEDALVAAVGCYTAVAPEDADRMVEVDLVLGSVDKEHVVAEAVERFADRLAAVGLADTHLLTPATGRTRRMIKIQEGCDANCTFCIVPIARGRSISVGSDRICREVSESAAIGYREVVLTGTYVGMYREEHRDDRTDNDAPPRRLAELLRLILAGETPPRIRLTSVGPAELKPDLLALWADRRLAPHLHMPIQSGSAPVLRAMRRRYNPEQFRRAVDRVRAAIPDCSITTDVIVGFPGETDADFAETLAFCREAGFSKIHAFPYSERAGTAAVGMAGQIAPEVKKERMAQFLTLSDELSRAFHRRFVGQTRDVLFEDRQPDGRWSGLTDNYIRVLVAGDGDLHNHIIPTRLTHAETAYMDGIPTIHQSRDAGALRGRALTHDSPQYAAPEVQ
jgi:threonylcarbamoyladenosine tRNA methylthiotransferase MtaB